jgi:hypothetical protein
MSKDKDVPGQLELPFDINSIPDPAEDLPVDYDAKRDDEDGDTPTEVVTLKEADFKTLESKKDPLEEVLKVVEAHAKVGLGGPIVAAEMRKYCILSLEELESRENG